MDLQGLGVAAALINRPLKKAHLPVCQWQALRWLHSIASLERTALALQIIMII